MMVCNQDISTRDIGTDIDECDPARLLQMWPDIDGRYIACVVRDREAFPIFRGTSTQLRGARMIIEKRAAVGKYLYYLGTVWNEKCITARYACIVLYSRSIICNEYVSTRNDILLHGYNIYAIHKGTYTIL